MTPLLAAAAEIQDFLQNRGWRFCILGGVAVIRWGQPRATQDVDISLLAEFGAEERYVEALLAAFSPRIADARQFAMQTRVLLISASNGVALDIALAGFPYEEQVIARATPFMFEADCELITVSAEDLIVLKLLAGRERDFADVDGILVRQGERLEIDSIRDQLRSLSGLLDDRDPLHDFEERYRRLTSTS
jgi:hypothetical protein